MAKYDKQRLKEKEAEKNRQDFSGPEKLASAPAYNNVMVPIRKGLTVYTNCESRVQEMRSKYADK